MRMGALELKIPPPLVALVCALLAWQLARTMPTLVLLPGGLRVPIAIFLVGIGFAFAAAGLLAFRRAHTTINPHSPTATRSIVRTGPYRFTRNPMYFGLACVLIGFCVWLGNPVAFLAVAIYVAYLTRFQIVPEERVLAEKFGAPYQDYLRAVRRWI